MPYNILPNIMVRVKIPFKRGGIPILRYNVQLSNDGKKFSANAMPVVIYDSKCVACDHKCRGRPGECSLKVRIGSTGNMS